MRRIGLILLALIVPFAHAALPIESWTTTSGARVLLVKNRALPMIDMRIEFDAGARYDPDGKEGLAALTHGMFARGIIQTGSESALTEAQISDAIADTAAQRGGGVGDDSAYISLRMLSTCPETCSSTALLARMLAHPAFPSDLLARDKARIIASIKESETKPGRIGARAFWRAMYGTHPYARMATAESVAAIQREDLVAFHRKHYAASSAVITIVGDVNKETANWLVDELTSRLPAGKDISKPVMPPVRKLERQEQRIAHHASQAHIFIGMPAVKSGDPDFFALTVGNYILGGGGFVSRLMHEVREKRGLSYSIYSSFQPRLQQGPFMIVLQTEKKQTDKALEIVRKVVRDFLRDGPTVEEVQSAQDNLTGSFAMQIDSNRKIMGQIARVGYMRLPLDYLDTWVSNVEKVTVSDVRRAFQKKIDLDRMATVVVGAPE